MITHRHVHLKDAHKTPQFWLIWLVLCMNVSAGIGIIGAASPMLQETFGGQLFGDPSVGFAAFNADQVKRAAAVGAAFVGLFSLFNIARALFLGVAFGCAWPQDHLLRLFRAGLRLLRGSAHAFGLGVSRSLRGSLLLDRFDVWRRLRDRSRLSGRHLRHAVRGRDPWQAAHGMVDGGHHRPGGGELPARHPQGRRVCRPISSTSKSSMCSPGCW